MSHSGPITVASFYRVRWGYQDEFLRLFRTNHYPVLRAQLAEGRLLQVRAAVPRLHGDGRADWTFLTLLTYRDWAALGDRDTSRRHEVELFPDQGRLRREEQRRFELLDAHWDVILVDFPLDEVAEPR